jgi:molybdopterin-guanine dinucleotide biosynthesis protein B
MALDLSSSRPTSPDPGPGAIPVIGFVGASGSGKTTLITALLPWLSSAGLRVAVMKHAHKGFDIDRPGKDSFRAREAGAAQVLLASSERWVLMGNTAGEPAEPPFLELLARFDPRQIDLILAEGFASETFPKIEVHRPSNGQPPKCWPGDPDVIAVASDAALAVSPPTRWLDLNRADVVANFILARLPELRPAESFHAD